MQVMKFYNRWCEQKPKCSTSSAFAALPVGAILVTPLCLAQCSCDFVIPGVPRLANVTAFSKKTYTCDASTFIAKEYVCVKAICLFVSSTMRALMSSDCDHNYLCSQMLLYRPFYGRLASQPPPPQHPQHRHKIYMAHNWLLQGWSLMKFVTMMIHENGDSHNSNQDFKSSVPGDEFALHGEGIYCKEDHELVER